MTVDTKKGRELLAAASPGPWRPSIAEHEDFPGAYAMGPACVQHDLGGPDDDRAYADAKLIEYMREHAEELLHAVDMLRAREGWACLHCGLYMMHPENHPECPRCGTPTRGDL